MNCAKECEKILKEQKLGIVRKVINKNNPWENNPFIVVQHLKGNYVKHFIVQIGDEIIDPFLQEGVLIPKEVYLEKVYKNHEELKIV